MRTRKVVQRGLNGRQPSSRSTDWARTTSSCFKSTCQISTQRLFVTRREAKISMHKPILAQVASTFGLIEFVGPRESSFARSVCSTTTHLTGFAALIRFATHLPGSCAAQKLAGVTRAMAGWRRLQLALSTPLLFDAPCTPCSLVLGPAVPFVLLLRALLLSQAHRPALQRMSSPAADWFIGMFSPLAPPFFDGSSLRSF